MERNIGDQLHKAFEAYRQASFEKESAERELRQKKEYYEKYTQQLEQKIEDKNQLIVKLKAQLSLATKYTSEEGNSCEPGLRKPEVEPLSASDQHPDNVPCLPQGRKQGSDCMEAAAMSPHTLPGSSCTENKDVLDAFRELQGKFCLIRTLAKKQKDHLRKICSGNNPANDQQFSMPIQCTDVTAEQAEGPYSTGIRAEAGEDVATASLASRGASPEDGEFMDSFSKLSVKFPPSTDSEYEFLNSAPEKHIEAVMAREGLVMVAGVPAAAGEQVARFPYPLLSPGSPSSPRNPDSIRGPQKVKPSPRLTLKVASKNYKSEIPPVWSPELCEATGLEASTDPQLKTSPENCAFCNAIVPYGHMYSHLNSHFLNDTSNGH